MDQPPQPNGFPPDGFSAPPVQPQIVQERVYVPAKPRSGIWIRLIVVLLLMGLFGSLMVNGLLVALLGLRSEEGEARVQEKFVSHNRYGAQKVAVLSIEGTIVSGEGFFKNQIDHARKDIEDGNLKAIVVRVNSPGGTISGSDYMLHHLRKLVDDTHIPVVVSMGPVAASGGYYVSMCVGDRPDTIFAEPSTWTGSIGVVIPHYNVADLIQKWGIQADSVASDPLKTMGSIARKMTPKEREIFQQLVDDGFTQFKDVIKQGRPKFRQDPAALDKLATGQIFTSQQAIENGLIDKIGFVEDAIDQAIKLAGLNKDNVQVVKYKAEPRLSDIIFGETSAQPAFDLGALLDSTAPRAYYLCTWLPVIAGTAK